MGGLLGSKGRGMVISLFSLAGGGKVVSKGVDIFIS